MRRPVYDIAVDDVSLVSSYRSQFNSILRRSSFAQLLKRLQSREASVVHTGESQGQERKPRSLTILPQD